MKRKFGQFLVVIGLILLVVFFTIDQSQKPQPGLFFSGLVGVFLGGLLIWRNQSVPKPSERFRSVRKAWQDRHKPKE
mgnify:CR=1 FL=1